MSSRDLGREYDGRDVDSDEKHRKEAFAEDDGQMDDNAILKDFEILKNYVKKQLKYIKEKEALCKKAIREKDEIRTKLQQSLEDRKQLEQRLSSRKTNESEMRRLKDKIEEIEVENAILVKANADIRKDAQRSGSEATLRDKLDAKNKQIQKLNAECEELKTRLSRMMGQKLLDGNPDITDLSDKNRPTKLGERYAELYDNQWTDAFEVAEAKVGERSDEEKEKECIRILLKILMEVKNFCANEAKLQDEEIKAAFFRTEKSQSQNGFTKDMAKQLKDIKKAVAPDAIDDVYKKFLMQTEKRTLREQMTHKLTGYVKECVSVCWLINMQDPPVVFGPNVEPGDPFNKSLYREYTSSGQKIEFVVWPPLLLHVNGPVLTKGVAQGLKVQSKEETTRSGKISAGSKKSSPDSFSRDQDAEVDDFFKSTKSSVTNKNYGQTSKWYDYGVTNDVDDDEKVYSTEYGRELKGQINKHGRDVYDKNHRRPRSQPEHGRKGGTADIIDKWRQNHTASAFGNDYDRDHHRENKDQPLRYTPSYDDYKYYLNCVRQFGHVTARAALGEDLYNACFMKESKYNKW